MVKCPNCGTDVPNTAVMCYACGDKLDDPFNLDSKQASLFKEANNAMDNENWTKAIEHYSQLIELRPDVSHFLICMGIAYAFLDKNDTTWECYTKAIKIKPSDEEPWEMRLEFSLEAPGHYLQSHIHEYIEQFGGSSNSLFKLAEAIDLVSNKHNNIVLDLCKKILNQDPENKKAIKLMRKIEKGPGLFSRLFG